MTANPPFLRRAASSAVCGSVPRSPSPGERAQPSADLGERHAENLADRLERTRARGAGQRLAAQHHLAVGGDQGGADVRGDLVAPALHLAGPAGLAGTLHTAVQDAVDDAHAGVIAGLGAAAGADPQQWGDRAGSVVHAGQPRAA
ncbi:hypothetical protein [Actinacidiphila sp. bgisy160]|uniref:hypothetical protein n=1 Tax=Actinacidiphila sp. bgisy160 TaxID=3413796 RepID=UPI003D762A7F